jgi:tRNA threonylcarbamoyladenosine biosynthesis protein TsaE
MQEKIITNSAEETQKLGEKLAKEIKSGKTAVVLGLQGDLGGGKTTFLQGFAKGLNIKEKILSPTFVILKHFKIKSSEFEDFYHVDCYRINQPEDILELGFKEIISNPKNILAIEWPERILKILPKTAVTIKFLFIDENKREITINF